MPLEHLSSHDRAVNVAAAVDTEAFGARVIASRGFHILDECGHSAVLRAADTDALLGSHQLMCAGIRTRLRIGDVHRVVFRDVNPARTAELPPFGDVLPILIEDLNAIVLAVADEQTAARIHRDRVWLANLAGTGSLRAPFLDELAVL